MNDNIAGVCTAPNGADFLDSFGCYILNFGVRDTVIAIAALAIFLFLVKLGKERKAPNSESFYRIILSLAEAYTCLIFVSAFVLTDPMAFSKLGEMQLRIAGLLAAIFLGIGAFTEVRKFLTPPSPPKPMPSNDGAVS